ncbi:MAG: phytochelatin synthase family protein [Myxococcota bacterium]|nr:phytochelatin synthase family protein [Myxococcota bacterium]
MTTDTHRLKPSGPSWTRRMIVLAVVAGIVFLGYRGYKLAHKAYIIANPVVDILTLPSSHIGMNTAEGTALLKASAQADYPALTTHFSAQKYRSYCGVASGVVATNALLTNSQFDQDNWFDDIPADLRSGWDTFFGGMTLEQFSALVQARGLSVDYHHGGQGQIETFRRTVKSGASNANDILVVNYSRKALDQQGWGHFSPVAAYHAETDRVLILDVAAYKYAPSWVKLDALWTAMATPDSDSGKNRGYAIIKKTR